jgi:KDO2-lipid IV(A) lauroyltransferase
MSLLEEGGVATPTLLNKAIEHQIKQNPSQYLWAYPRYKVRALLLKKEATEL